MVFIASVWLAISWSLVYGKTRACLVSHRKINGKSLVWSLPDHKQPNSLEQSPQWYQDWCPRTWWLIFRLIGGHPLFSVCHISSITCRICASVSEWPKFELILTEYLFPHYSEEVEDCFIAYFDLYFVLWIIPIHSLPCLYLSPHSKLLKLALCYVSSP